MSSKNGKSKIKKENPDIEMFLYESFDLLFGDEFQNMPSTLLNLFKGNFKNTFDNREFLDSKDRRVLALKFLILQSARIAFHYALECYIMGETELSEFQQFEIEIK